MDGLLLGERFRVEREVRRGEFGAVCVGSDLRMNRPVTIKLPDAARLAEPAARDALRAGLVGLGRVSHVGLAPLLDYDLDGPVPYIVTAAADGRTLGDRLRAGERLAPDEAARVGREAADVLAAVHKAGLVHGALTPDSVLLTDDGGVRLLDLEEPPGAVESLERARYSAPEQLVGQPAQPRSDLYSLAAILYHALVGRPPFDAPDITALGILKHTGRPPALDALRPDVPPILAAALGAALERDPSDRPVDAAALAAALGRPSSTPVVDAPPPPLDATQVMNAPVAQQSWTPPPPPAEPEPSPMDWSPPLRVAPARAKEGCGVGPVFALLMVAAVAAALYFGLIRHHGQIEVPSIGGKNEQQARAALSELGLQAVMMDSEYDDQVPDGQVLRQDPAAGSWIDKQTVVKFTLSKGSKFVAVPTLTNLAERDARNAVLKAGLKYGSPETVQQADQPNNVVVDQSPKPGQKVERSTPIIVFINKRSKDADVAKAPDQGKKPDDKTASDKSSSDNPIDKTLDTIKKDVGAAVGDSLDKAKDKTREAVKAGEKEAGNWIQRQLGMDDKDKGTKKGQ